MPIGADSMDNQPVTSNVLVAVPYQESPGRQSDGYRCSVAGTGVRQSFQPRQHRCRCQRPGSFKLDSNDSGCAVHFCTLPILEALITEAGRYNLVGSYDPDVTFQDVSSRFHGDPLAVPSHISFNRHVPTSLLVVSPFTGLYLGTVSASTTNAGQCVESWQDLTPSLPTSRAYITGTGFVGDIALITTEGRGAYAIYDASTAQPASYFDTQASAQVGGQVATLRDGKGAAVAWGSVRVSGRSISSQTPVHPDGPLFDLTSPDMSYCPLVL